MQLLLENHTAEHFPFLTAAHPRCRTQFYQALGRMLLLESADDVVRFERFMAPLAVVLQVPEASVSSYSLDFILFLLISIIVLMCRESGPAWPRAMPAPMCKPR